MARNGSSLPPNPSVASNACSSPCSACPNCSSGSIGSRSNWGNRQPVNHDMAEQDSRHQTVPPHAQLVQMATAHWVSHVVYVAAKLSLADRLAKGPQSAETLAGPTGTHAPSLYRLMRTLASLGILTEDASHRFALTPLGDALKTGAPGSARATVRTRQ